MRKGLIGINSRQINIAEYDKLLFVIPFKDYFSYIIL